MTANRDSLYKEKEKVRDINNRLKQSLVQDTYSSMTNLYSLHNPNITINTNMAMSTVNTNFPKDETDSSGNMHRSVCDNRQANSLDAFRNMESRNNNNNNNN